MKTKKIRTLILLVLVLVIPWFNMDTSNDYSIPKVSQEDTSFYEVNPCKISLSEFLLSNPESIYQNHFYFRPDNRSSIQCFGRISGVTVLQKNLETQFFISVGTSSLINLLLQALIWTVLFSFIPKNKELEKIKDTLRYKNIIILLIAYLLTFSVYAEGRFYEQNMYLVDLQVIKSYVLIFSIFTLLVKNFTDIFITRSENIVNYLPFIFLITGLFSGFNLSFFSIIFLYYGLQTNLIGVKNRVFNYTFLTISIWWLLNSKGSAFFNIGKLRGFTSSIFEFNANLFWILFTYLLIRGIWRIYLLNKESFSLSVFTKNLSITSGVLLLFGIVSANLPIFNFINYYILGLQRYGVESKTPFAFDEYSVKISWRGIFPSSETIGEFYGLCLLFLLFYIFNSSKVTFVNYIGIFTASLGLYFSDNRTTIILIFISTLSYVLVLNRSLIKINKLKVVGFFAIIFSFTVIYLAQLNTSAPGYEFMSNSITSKALTFQKEYAVSSFNSLISGLESSHTASILFGFLSVIGYLLNRSEMWGLFVARYNPTFNELLFGTGPLNFGQLYGEVPVNSPDSLLLPHSSVLSYLVFIGLIPMTLLLVIFLKDLYKNRTNVQFIIFSIYISINIFKNDSMNYFSPFVMYAILYLILRGKKDSVISE
ncbi:hypothetical protein N9L62_02075 [Candidatus Actinomarina sp.]|nr:hypothetical protein [Candidatus Actinomarina sp.]